MCLHSGSIYLLLGITPDQHPALPTLTHLSHKAEELMVMQSRVHQIMEQV